MLAATLWEQPCAGASGNWQFFVLLVSLQWSLVCWWHFGGMSAVFLRYVTDVFKVSRSGLCVVLMFEGVIVVSWWYRGNGIFLDQVGSPAGTSWHQMKWNICYWGCVPG